MAITDALKKLQRLFADSDQKTNVAFKGLNKLDAQKQQMLQAAAKKVEPLIRLALQESWDRAGIKSDTGELHAAAVTGALVTFSPSGFKVSFAPGTDIRTIKAGAALNFGWVKGQQSANIKKIVKSGGKVEGAGQAYPARKFFLLSPEQVQVLQDKFIESMQVDVNQTMRQG